jgi:hypothetical protein
MSSREGVEPLNGLRRLGLLYGRVEEVVCCFDFDGRSCRVL